MEYLKDDAIGDGATSDAFFFAAITLPAIFSTILFTLGGSRRYHYLKTIAVAVVSITPAAIFVFWMFGIIATIMGGVGWSWVWEEPAYILTYMGLVYFFTTLGATIIWLIFGRAPSIET